MADPAEHVVDTDQIHLPFGVHFEVPQPFEALGVNFHMTKFMWLEVVAALLMILSAAFALASWDLVLFDHSLSDNPISSAATRALFQNRHYRSLALALGLGLLIVFVGRTIQVQISFVIIGLFVLLALFSIDPVFIERVHCHATQVRREFTEVLKDERTRFLVRVGLVSLSHWGEQIIPGQLFLAEALGLVFEVLAEHGDGIVHGGQHRFERGAVKAGGINSRMKGIFAPAFFV